MRWLMRALLALALIASLFVPCPMPFASSHHQNPGPGIVVTAYTLRTSAGNAHDGDIQHDTRDHCQQVGLALISGPFPSSPTALQSFGLASEIPMSGLTLPAIQRPPIFKT